MQCWSGAACVWSLASVEHCRCSVSDPGTPNLALCTWSVDGGIYCSLFFFSPEAQDRSEDLTLSTYPQCLLHLFYPRSKSIHSFSTILSGRIMMTATTKNVDNSFKSSTSRYLFLQLYFSPRNRLCGSRRPVSIFCAGVDAHPQSR